MLLLLIAAGAGYVWEAGGPGVVLAQGAVLLRDCYSLGSAVIRTVLLGGDMKTVQPAEVILAPETEGEYPAEQDTEQVILAPARPPAEGERGGSTTRGADERRTGGPKKAPPKKAPPEKKKYKPSGVG